MLKKIGIIISFIVLIYGINIVGKWYHIHQNYYKEGNTLEEISLDTLLEVEYVSFYIDDYAQRVTYIDDDIEYEVYTILVEHDVSNKTKSYVQVMVKNQDTKNKLNNLNQEKVRFSGEVFEGAYAGLEFNDAWGAGVPEGMDIDCDRLVTNILIKETEVPKEGNDIYIGISLVILALVGYYLIGGIKGCVPDVIIVSHKYDLHSIENGTQVHNIRNEWLCEKDNLKNLQTEQIKNNKVCNVMIAVFLAGVIMFFNASMLVMKIMAFMLMFFGIGGVWSKFINSSHKLAVYIAVKRGKRSIYVEMEKCKKNIEKLKTILDKKS